MRSEHGDDCNCDSCVCGPEIVEFCTDCDYCGRITICHEHFGGKICNLCERLEDDDGDLGVEDDIDCPSHNTFEWEDDVDESNYDPYAGCDNPIDQGYYDEY